MIQVKDIVIHTLSKLYFICENKKQQVWMNNNPYYKLTKDIVSIDYFRKN